MTCEEGGAACAAFFRLSLPQLPLSGRLGGKEARMFGLQSIQLNIAVALCLPGMLMPGPASADDQPDAAAFKTSREIAPKVRKKYCGEHPFYGVKILKDADGNIGGYVLQPAIRDAPIPFLDHEGNMLTSFHIFGSDEEKRAAMAIVGPLTKRFPAQERLSCDTGPADQ
jgi:hypothetical protein